MTSRNFWKSLPLLLGIVTILGCLGIIIPSVRTAWAQTLQEKDFRSFRASADDCDTVSGGCSFRLLAGLSSGNVVRPLLVTATGALSLSPDSKTAVATFQLNCGSTATQLTASAGRSVTITALAANTAAVYVGDSTVTATTGHELVQSSSYSDDMDNANRFYCFSTAGTMDISVIVTN